MLKPFATLKASILSNRWYFIIGFIALMIVDVMQLLIPRVVKQVIDSLTIEQATQAIILRCALSVFIMGIFIVTFRFIWRYCIIGTSRRIERELRNLLFRHILRLPLQTLQHTKTGDIMARMTNDLEAVRMCAGIGLVALVDTVFLGIASIAFMLYISPALTCITLAPMLLIILTTWRLSSMLHKRFANVQAAFSSLTEKVRETVAGIAVVKAYAMEGANSQSFNDISNEYIQKNLGLVKIMGLFFPLIIVFSNLSVCLLIYFGGHLTIAASITPGDFVAFASYVWILTWPMMAMGWVVNLFQRGSASMIRINELLDSKPEEAAGPALPVQAEVAGSIALKNLSFSYSYGSAPVLDNLSIVIPAGSTIGITGETGSGKTSLCNLLLRLFEPPPGALLIDGRDVRDLPLQYLRSQIAYVPQDNFLFSDSISNNITFGQPGASPADIRRQAAAAQFLDDLSGFQDGLETMVGERGSTLSGGQKQRLCIARALLLNTPILILDDAMSSLDVATTQRLVADLASSRADRTSIIVSNRIATIQHADTILVFSQGRILESGTHAELIAQDGLYRKLFKKQQLEHTTE
ncbi:ABC transporter ATP-binding protein [Thermodesulfobacteriota bacterium]